MNELTLILLLTLFAGACIPLGGLLGYFESIRPRWLENELRHAIIAFGGGILVAAVALVLVPEGKEYVQHDLGSVLIFLAGGVFFFMMERFLGLKRREKRSLPHVTRLPAGVISLRRGFRAGFTDGTVTGTIHRPAKPAGRFNAYRELVAQPGSSKRKILGFMLLLALLGPIIGLLGYTYFAESEVLLGAVMLFASGGILYLIFQDIAPQSRMQHHWAPPLGAVLGFCLGLLGQSLVTS